MALAVDNTVTDTSVANRSRIVAAFDTREAGERAHAALIEAGVPESEISQLEGEIASQSVGDQLLQAMMSLFSGRDDKKNYSHSMAAGHVLIVVRPSSEEDRARIEAVLEQSGPVDLPASILPGAASPGQAAPSASRVRVYQVPG